MKAKDSPSEARAVSRFVLRYRGQGTGQAEDIERIRASPNVTVIDDSSPHMLLVDAPDAELTSLVSKMPDWVMAREQMIQLPDPRPKVRRGVRNKK